jgi:MoxR-like ATPase
VFIETKMNTTTSTPDLLFQKRMILSAKFWTSCPRGVTRMVRNWKLTHNRDPQTISEIREALNWKNDELWDKFVNDFIVARTIIRTGSGNVIQSCHKPSHNSRIVEVRVTSEDNAPQSQQSSTPSLQPELDALREQYNSLLNDNAKLAKDAEIAAKKAETPSKPLDIIVENRITNQKVELSAQHYALPALLARLAERINVYLVGPAGSGKTFAAEAASLALSVDFGFMPVGPQTTESKILGYMSANGAYVSTEFRRRYEFGGVFLFDEIDAGNGGVLTCINSALAGTACAFPDAMVKRHANFICIAAGNTYGTGPDRVYVGRQELDGASLDRFDFLEWGYDEALENHIAASIDATLAASWTPYVQSARKAITKLGIRHVVSPRATINGIKLLRNGRNIGEVRTTALWKSLKPADVTRVVATMKADGFVNA